MMYVDVGYSEVAKYKILCLVSPAGLAKNALASVVRDNFGDEYFFKFVCMDLQGNKKKKLEDLYEQAANNGFGLVVLCDPKYSYLSKTKFSLATSSLEDKFNFPTMIGENFLTVTANKAKLDRLYSNIKQYFSDPSNYRATFPIDTYMVSVKYNTEFLASFLDAAEVALDIETTNLSHPFAKILSFSVTDSEYNTVSSVCDEKGLVDLKFFLENYRGKLIFHGGSYDLKVLLFRLYMVSVDDRKGMLEGIQVIRKLCLEDTMLMAYLCYNSVIKPSLSLKSLVAEFAGDYALSDIKYAIKVPEKQLLRYNAMDTLSTMWLYKKLSILIHEEEQYEVYREQFIPNLVTLLYTELTGITLNRSKVIEANIELDSIISDALNKLRNTAEYKKAQLVVQQADIDKHNARLKTKVVGTDEHPLRDLSHGSDPDMRALFFTVMGLPVLELTDKTKEPSTSAKVMSKLLNWPSISDSDKQIVEYYCTLVGASKIRSTFIKAFLKAIPINSKEAMLFGNFNLTGTISTRLSSSNPNLTNIPSKGVFEQLVKQCFVAPTGFLFGGADFSSLEDMVSALQTKDPNKLDIYLKGYDSHSFRAYHYWPEKFPDIDPTKVDSINSIAKIASELRQASKAPSFALTYKGTFLTLMKNCGFTEEEAKEIEANFHKLYAVSTNWVAARLTEAANSGYVVLAFGTKLRTPQIASTRKIPHKVAEEERSAGNALGQSYCSLTLRALTEFMNRLWDSEYRDKVYPCITIHDAIYLYWENSHEVGEWVNKNLIECMKWQELPDIKHDTVKLGAELEVFYPHWGNPITYTSQLHIPRRI